MKQPTGTKPAAAQGAWRDAQILKNVALVYSIARIFQRRLPPSVGFDDLASAGMVGLIQAVDHFEHARNLQFGTYARHRIRGAILDYLREEDPLSRAERRRLRESAGELETVPKPTVSLDEVPLGVLSRLEAPGQLAFTVRSELRQARQCLSDRENRVIRLLYDFGWKRHEVAGDLKVNGSRVSQIQQSALSKLRRCLQPGSEPGETRNAALPQWALAQ